MQRAIHKGRSVWLAVCLAAVLLSIASTAGAQGDPTQPNTSRAAQQDALRSIPLDEFDADAREKLASVIRQTTVFRRLPVQVVECDPRLHIFLVRHPEVIVEIWKKMGITVLDVQRTGPESFRVKDSAGTDGSVEFLFGDAHTHVLYCQGEYRGPLSVRPMKAESIVVVKSGYVQREDGSYLVTNRVDTFVHIQNLGAKAIAKTFHNVFGKAADQNLEDTAGFITMLGRTAEANGPGIQRLAGRLTALEPAVRTRFVELTGQVYSDALQREAAIESGATVVRGQMTGAER